MKKQRLFSIMLVIAIFTGILTACGTREVSNPTTTAAVSEENTAAVESSTAATEPVTLTFMSWAGGGEQEADKKAIEAFNKANPGVTVKAQFVDNANYNTKLNTLMAANQAPDISQLNGNLSPEFGEKGQLLDLAPYFQKNGVDTSDVIPTALYRYGEKIWGIDFGVQAQLVFYNKKLFEQNGISAPGTDANNPWTWDEYVAAAKKITTDSNGKHPGEEGFNEKNVKIWGTILQNWSWYNFTMLNSNGGAYIAPDGMSTWVDKQESIDVLQKMADLIYKEKVAPKPSVSKGLPSWEKMIENGTCGIIIGGQWMNSTFGTNKFYDYGTAPLPKFKKPTNMVWGEPLVIFKSSKNPDVAFKFLMHIINPESSIDLFASGAHMPIYKSWYSDPEKLKKWTDNQIHQDDFKALIPTLFNMCTTREANYVKNYDAIMNIINPVLDKIWNGIPAADAVKGIQGKVKNEVKGAWQVVDYTK